MSKSTSVKAQKLKSSKNPIQQKSSQKKEKIPVKSENKRKNSKKNQVQIIDVKPDKASAKIKPRPPKSIKKVEDTEVVKKPNNEITQTESPPKAQPLEDVEIYRGKNISEVLKDYFVQLDGYEKKLIEQFDNIELSSEEDFVVKSQIFSSVLKEINSTHKNKKEFIQSLLDYQIKSKQIDKSVSVGGSESNPLSSVQNFMLFINNIQDAKSEKKISEAVINNMTEQKDNLDEFLRDSEEFNPTKVFLENSEEENK